MTTVSVDRSALARTVAIANGKGGVGKTSLTSHIGGVAAIRGWRTLLVDLDPQGNVADDLGVRAKGDHGLALKQAVVARNPPLILTDVRPGLDVVPGGRELEELADYLGARRRRNGYPAAVELAVALAPHVGPYDLVLIDCPPVLEVMQEAALVMARHLLIPTRTDASSRLGLTDMAQRFVAARHANPDLDLLGVVLFGVDSAATKVRQQARDWVTEALRRPELVLHATVRLVEAAAYDIRERGQLAFELAGDGGTVSMDRLAADYIGVAAEVMTRLIALERAS